jgi:threonine dehydratase
LKGGLTSGVCVATKSINKNIKIFGTEPENANDAKISLKSGKIYKFEKSPISIAGFIP